MRVHKLQLSLVMVVVLTCLSGLACDSDYVIWMIRSPTADPLYRFVVDGKSGYIDQKGTYESIKP